MTLSPDHLGRAAKSSITRQTRLHPPPHQQQPHRRPRRRRWSHDAEATSDVKIRTAGVTEQASTGGEGVQERALRRHLLGERVVPGEWVLGYTEAEQVEGGRDVVFTSLECFAMTVMSCRSHQL